MLQILIRFQIVGFCRLNDAVNNSAGLCPLNRVNDMPVGSPNAERAYGSLACGIVNWYFAVLQEGSEILLLVYAVL